MTGHRLIACGAGKKGRARRLLAVALASISCMASTAAAATIKPDTLADELNADGDCSLREAVQSANTNSAVDGCKKGQAKLDSIKIGSAEHMLTIPTTDEQGNANGDLDYTGGGPLALAGPRPGKGYISSQVADRVIETSGNASSLRIKRIQIKLGDATGLDKNDGGNIYVGDGDLHLLRVEILGGVAGSGGGVYVVSGMPIRVDRSTFGSNQAITGGGLGFLSDGGSRVTRSYFAENAAVSGAARGGAITYSGDGLTIADTWFSDNRAESTGGGSALGGAIYGSPLDITRSLFSGNETLESSESVGADGGAIRTFEGARITNTTFFENESADRGGAFIGEGLLSHVTFYRNTAEADGDHIAPITNIGEHPLTIRNSIFPGAAIAVDLCGSDGTITSKGFSVATYDDPDCNFLDSDLTGIGSPGLDPLGLSNNGGATGTVTIDKSSAARNVVPNRKCKSAKGEDQRGYGRPRGPRCDAGAYERGAKP